MTRQLARRRPVDGMTGDLFPRVPVDSVRSGRRLSVPGAGRLARPGAPGRSHRRSAGRGRAARTARRSSIEILRQAAMPALALLIVVNFLLYAIFGSNGILRLADYRALNSERRVELALLVAERTRLAHHSGLLDPRAVDPDLADELIRRNLGLVRPDEVIISIGY
jgi:cell division protein FtsB